MVAGQQHDWHAGIGQHVPSALQHGLRHAMVVECIAGQQHDIGRQRLCFLQRGLQSQLPVIAADGTVLDVEVGCMHQRDIAGCGWLGGHW